MRLSRCSRRTVTFVFTDIEGSTALLAARRPARARRWARPGAEIGER
jgi:class 3 adenylate cyclase